MKKRTLTKGMLMAALICGCVQWGGTTVHAAELQEFTLDPMVVTAQRMETRDLDTPASVSVITAKDIEDSGAKTAYEIIERQVGFTNNAYGPGGIEFGASCSRTVLRGLDKGTLVMVNGAPINMLNYNSMDGIPVDAIEKIEIVRGAQSVLYGAEAFGGVVNIITKKGVKPKTSVSMSAGNYNQKWALSHSGEKYTVNIDRNYLGDISETNKIFEKSTRRWEFDDSTKTSAFITINPNDKLSFNYARTEGKYYRNDWTLKGGKGTENGKIKRYLYDDTRDNVSMVYDDKENLFKSVVSYNRREVDPYSGTGSDFKYAPLTRQTSSDNVLETMTWDTQKTWNLRDDKDYLIAGFTAQKEDCNDRGKLKTADRQSAALYASYKHQFTPVFETTLGVRGQFIDDFVKDENVFLPQLQTLYKVNDNTSWYTNFGKSFQMPALNQYFSEGRTEDLKPQEGWTYETGVKIVNDTHSWKFNVFHMDIDGKFDWVYLQPTDPDKSLINAGKFRNTGMEVEYNKYVNEKFSYKLGASLSNPETQEYGSDIYEQSEAKLQLTAGLDYKIGKLTSNLNYLYLGKREASYYDSLGVKGNADNRTVPYRSLLNANFTYRADDRNTVALALNNILDTEDTINKYENWGMPFNWTLTYTHTF